VVLVRRQKILNLKNKIIPMLEGKRRYILGSKPADVPNRSICLLSTMSEDGEYSYSPKDREYTLWNIEGSDEGENVYLWPYKGEDSDALIIELMKDFLDNAFQE
jgi:hypothetical protein